MIYISNICLGQILNLTLETRVQSRFYALEMIHLRKLNSFDQSASV